MQQEGGWVVGGSSGGGEGGAGGTPGDYFLVGAPEVLAVCARHLSVPHSLLTGG